MKGKINPYLREAENRNGILFQRALSGDLSPSSGTPVSEELQDTSPVNVPGQGRFGFSQGKP